MVKVKRRIMRAGLAALLLCLCHVARGQAATPSPRAIIRGMVARYATASSYSDSGLVRRLPDDPSLLESVGGRGAPGAPARDDGFVTFKTYFARPRLFRFEWEGRSAGASREAVVWSDGRRAYSWGPNIAGESDNFILVAGPNLRVYVQEAVRSSGGAAFTVASILMKGAYYDSFGVYLAAMTELSLLEGEVMDGEPCYVIKGKIYGNPWLLWVGKKSRLLRKTRTLYTRGSFHERASKGAGDTFIAEEFHRDITINGRLPRSLFTRRGLRTGTPT
jgi:hypothetical protein